MYLFMTFGQPNLFRVVLTEINMLIKLIKLSAVLSLPPLVIYPAEDLNRS